MNIGREKKRWIAIGIAAILLLGGLLLFLGTREEDDITGEATLEDLLYSRSERKIDATTAAVTGSCPLYTMTATPVAQYYDGSRNLHSKPLLIYRDQPLMKSNPANDFLDHYMPDDLIMVGDASGLSHDPSKRFIGSLKDISINLAREHWTSSDGAVLVEKTVPSYDEALYTTLLASYVNIPVIISDRFDQQVEDLLKDLDVKYTILAGDIKGYGRVMRFETPEEAQNMTLELLRHPDGFSTEPRYLTIANPSDGFETAYTTVDEQQYSGEVFHIYTPGPGAYAGLEEASEGVDFEYTVPEDTQNGIMRFSLSFKPHEQDEIDGERIYCFIFYEDPEDGWKDYIYYIGTCAGIKDGAYETAHFDVPVLGAVGNYRFHVEGRNTYEAGSGNLVKRKPVPFYLNMRLDSLDSPVYANMEMVSAISPYQCAHHLGILMAKSEYAMHYPMINNITGALEPTVHEESHGYVNSQALKVKDDELALLSRIMDGEEIQPGDIDRIASLADRIYSDPFHICIVGDTNMIPHFYHESGSHAAEGLGQAGDIIYCDIDMDPENPREDYGEGVVKADIQDYELPIGRLAGYDVLDVSAQVARTFFYDDIIDEYWSHGQDADDSWKDNGYVFLGSKMPVETMYGTYVRTLSDYMSEADFDVIGTTEERSDYKLAHQFQEGSNYVMGGVHGNFYWYVPQCHINAIAGGSAYDVTNVLEMSMGPSTMFLVSCITGRIDGLAPENCLSMAYIHAGVASYVGATRSTLGFITAGLEFDMRPIEPEGAVLLSEYYTANLLDDRDAGTALRDAKNSYLPEDTSGGGIVEASYIMVQHYVLYGDPAFNPYEPRNG